MNETSTQIQMWQELCGIVKKYGYDYVTHIEMTSNFQDTLITKVIFDWKSEAFSS